MNPQTIFNIQIGDDLTWNVQPILHEVRHALSQLIDTGETAIIDLRSIPLAPGEEQKLIDVLGRGEVHADLNALGPSEILETRFSGVWLVTHFNEENSIISRFIEITEIPDILKSQREDMIEALDTLEQQLTSGQLTETTDTTSEADQ
jgi:HupH hydrogenase expression protein, C-terminal conserved region